MIHPDTITDFLPYVTSQKFVSLVIADSDTAAEKGVTELEGNGYHSLVDPHDLETEGLRYIRVTKENAKDMYDLAAQYGTGQITMYDKTVHQATWINPQYAKSALVYVITKSDVDAIESSGLPLRTVTGLTTQIV